MGSLSPWHIALVVVVGFLIFGVGGSKKLFRKGANRVKDTGSGIKGAAQELQTSMGEEANTDSAIYQATVAGKEKAAAVGTSALDAAKEARESVASLADDVLFVTMNGLSKNYRACGYRAGWMIVSGEKRHAKDYIDGLNILAAMRLCPNVPGQYAIQTALGGYQSINDLVGPGGRLTRQRDMAYEMLSAIPGVHCMKPKGTLYMFPRLDPKLYPIQDDQQFILELLEEEKVLLVQGTGFNWPQPDHFRLVFLPNTDDLQDSMQRITRFFDGYRRRYGNA